MVCDTETFPKTTGVMLLPGICLFPGSLLPLTIFELKYRKMLENALHGERMFAVAHVGEDGDVASVGGLGVIRACVAKEDGTSQLVLQGLGRVRFSRFKVRPFPQATIVRLPEILPSEAQYSELRQGITEAFRLLKNRGMDIPQGFSTYLEQISQPGAFADALAAALIQDPVERRGLLEEADVALRLSRLLRCLMRQLEDS